MSTLVTTSDSIAARTARMSVKMRKRMKWTRPKASDIFFSFYSEPQAENFSEKRNRRTSKERREMKRRGVAILAKSQAVEEAKAARERSAQKLLERTKRVRAGIVNAKRKRIEMTRQQDLEDFGPDYEEEQVNVQPPDPFETISGKERELDKWWNESKEGDVIRVRYEPGGVLSSGLYMKCMGVRRMLGPQDLQILQKEGPEACWKSLGKPKAPAPTSSWGDEKTEW